MLRARLVEDKLASLYRAGRIVGGVYLGRGQEAFSAAGGLNLRKGDVYAPLIRDMAGRLAFGEPILDAVRTYLGSRLGPMRGRDGNIHRGDLELGILHDLDCLDKILLHELIRPIQYCPSKLVLVPPKLHKSSPWRDQAIKRTPNKELRGIAFLPDLIKDNSMTQGKLV